MVDLNNAHVNIDDTWLHVLEHEFFEPYFIALKSFLLQESIVIYPDVSFIYNAFTKTPFDKVKIVILGQDPYHGIGQAHGLSFSVPDGVKKPPSLVNIFKELSSDLGITMPKSGNLEQWTRQGVFLLNSTLTVQASKAGSHQKKGWEQFTDRVIHLLSQKRSNIVFILWGNYARAKRALIDSNKHLILEAAHPSPFSAYNGFFGCKHFSQANEYLVQHGLSPIDWNIDS